MPTGCFLKPDVLPKTYEVLVRHKAGSRGPKQLNCIRLCIAFTPICHSAGSHSYKQRQIDSAQLTFLTKPSVSFRHVNTTVL